MAKQNVGSTKAQGGAVTTVFLPVKRTELPASQFARVAGPPQIRISENGQIQATKKATEILGGKAAMNYILLGYDAATRRVQLKCYPALPQKFMEKYGLTADDFFTVNKSEKAKSDNIYFGAASWLRQVGYDFVASGSQNFDLAGSDAEKHTVEFILPEGALTPKPKQTRKRKPKTDGTAATAPATAATATAPTAPATADEDDDEPELGEDDDES